MRTYANNVSDTAVSTGPVSSPAAASRPNQHANPFLSLQRTVGNRIVQRWLRAQGREPEAEPADRSPARTPEPNSPPPSTLQRQSNTNSSAPSAPVDPARFRARVAEAVGRLSGRLVSAETVAPVVQPVLQAMVANAVWRDAAGREQGGGFVSYTVPGNPPVMLRAVFDDRPLVPGVPLPDGDFHPGPAPSQGTLVLYVRKFAAADDITPLLFHESLHMVAWLLRHHRGAAHI